MCWTKIFIFILEAGGSSKRLPNLTCTGKLFCPLPLEVQGRATDLLNLKFIITSPFLQLVKNGGMFICASDDIETFCFDGNGTKNLIIIAVLIIIYRFKNVTQVWNAFEMN